MNNIIVPDEKIKEIFDLSKTNMNVVSISKIVNLSRYVTDKIIRLTNTEYKSKGNRIIEFNEHYFHEIDSPRKAYWLGFLAADGSNSEKCMTLGLSVIDKDHIVKFLKEIGSTHKILHSFSKSPSSDNIYEHCYTNVTSKIFSNNLSKHGIIRNKTLVLKPPVLEEKYEIDFLRGYFDGDGGFSRHTTKRDGRLQTCISITSTLEMCQYFSTLLKKYGFVVCMTKRFKHDGKNNYTILVSGNYNVLKFSYLIYNKSEVFMNRKLRELYDIYTTVNDSTVRNKFCVQKREKSRWHYWYKYEGKVYDIYGFETKQDAFSESLLGLLSLGHISAVQKTIEINTDCEIPVEAEPQIIKLCGNFYLNWVKEFRKSDIRKFYDSIPSITYDVVTSKPINK